MCFMVTNLQKRRQGSRKREVEYYMVGSLEAYSLSQHVMSGDLKKTVVLQRFWVLSIVLIRLPALPTVLQTLTQILMSGIIEDVPAT